MKYCSSAVNGCVVRQFLHVLHFPWSVQKSTKQWNGDCVEPHSLAGKAGDCTCHEIKVTTERSFAVNIISRMPNWFIEAFWLLAEADSQLTTWWRNLDTQGLPSMTACRRTCGWSSSVQCAFPRCPISAKQRELVAASSWLGRSSAKESLSWTPL